jgi:hypothetical protein
MPERRRKKTLATHPRKALPKKRSKLKTGDKVSIELVVGPTTACLNVKIDNLVVPMNSFIPIEFLILLWYLRPPRVEAFPK